MVFCVEQGAWIDSQIKCPNYVKVWSNCDLLLDPHFEKHSNSEIVRKIFQIASDNSSEVRLHFAVLS
jgi:hypothetical protein